MSATTERQTWITHTHAGQAPRDRDGVRWINTGGANPVNSRAPWTRPGWYLHVSDERGGSVAWLSDDEATARQMARAALALVDGTEVTAGRA